MPTKNQNRFDLLGGSREWEFKLGLTDNTSDNPRTVHFCYLGKEGENVQIDVSLNGLTIVGGSGEQWLFKGYQVGGGNVNGFYSTKTRRGWIEFES